MYYYIYEPVKSGRDKSYQEKVKRLVTNLGISGEAVMPNPARTIDELVDIGLSKNYSTIVAIGSDLFANKVASSLLNHHKQEEQRVVFGFVAQDFQQSNLAKLIEVGSVEEACQALRYRRIKTMSIGIIKPNKFFLTPLSIQSSNEFKLTLQLPDLEITSEATELCITPDMIVEWQNDNLNLNFFSKMYRSIMGNKQENNSYSIIKTDRLSLRTEPSTPIHLNSEIIAKTPMSLVSLPDYLHIIVNRATLTEVQRGESKT